MRSIFKDLEYIIFGGYGTDKIDIEESRKLDIATGGEDMPELETEEEAKRRPRSKKANECVDKIKEIIKERKK